MSRVSKDKTKICKGCGKEFQAKRNDSKYCSKSCFGKNNENARKNLTSHKVGEPNKSKGISRPKIQGKNHPFFGKTRSEETKKINIIKN